jgi:hypothetical protein
MSIIQNIDFPAEHKKWDDILSLFQAEVKVFENRLQEVVEGNASMESRKSIEHFQNQFIVQLGNIAKLKNHIQKHELALARATEPQETTAQDVKHHEIMSEKINVQIQAMKDLTNEFSEFIEKVL